MKRIGFVFNPQIRAGESLARQLADDVRARGVEAWVLSAWDEPGIRAQWDHLDLAVTLGGDGTIVRVARLAAPLGVPIVGVNLGRLGFLTELGPEEAREKLPLFLNDHCWVEERTMLSVRLGPEATQGPALTSAGEEAPQREYVALNDAMVGRGQRARVVQIIVRVDGATLTEYHGDGVLVASATGSTAYSLTAGGSVLHPEAPNLLVTPILPHLMPMHSVVLPPEAAVDIAVQTDHEASLSVDGQIDLPLRDGAAVRVSASPHRCRFLRARPRTYFYQNLTQRLRLGPGHE